MVFSDTLPRFPITEDTRFLILHTPKTFHKVSPFVIQRLISSFIGEVKSTKKLPSGDLLIETSSKSQIAASQILTKLGDFPVEVTPHRTLNFSRGVISDLDLFECSETELVQELHSQKVCAAHRIKIKRNGAFIPTKHVILTFSSPELPKFIRAGYIHCKVKPYVPNPLRCFKCQRFGHSQGTCRGIRRCAKCSSDDHETSVCSSQTLKCLNCSGPHPAYSRDCPKWQTEKEIQNLKVRKNISYSEAKKLVLVKTPKPGLSYSDALKSTLKCTGSQTEISDITLKTCSCKHLTPESVKSNNSQKTEKSQNQASTSKKNFQTVSQSKDSNFSLARLNKKKRKNRKSDTEIPPQPPDIPITSDNVLSIGASDSSTPSLTQFKHTPNEICDVATTSSNSSGFAVVKKKKKFKKLSKSANEHHNQSDSEQISKFWVTSPLQAPVSASMNIDKSSANTLNQNHCTPEIDSEPLSVVSELVHLGDNSNVKIDIGSSILEDTIDYDPNETIEDTKPVEYQEPPLSCINPTSLDKHTFKKNSKEIPVKWVNFKSFYSSLNNPVHDSYLKKHNLKRLL